MFFSLWLHGRGPTSRGTSENSAELEIHNFDVFSDSSFICVLNMKDDSLQCLRAATKLSLPADLS